MNNFREGRVLIVDNLEKWREELVETLQRAGFYADSASSAAEALKRLNETLYHVMDNALRLWHERTDAHFI